LILAALDSFNQFILNDIVHRVFDLVCKGKSSQVSTATENAAESILLNDRLVLLIEDIEGW